MSLVERTLKKLQESKQGAPQGVAQGAPPARQAATPQRLPSQEGKAVPPMPSGERKMVPVESTRVVIFDRESLRQQGLLPSADIERQIAGQYQHVKRPLVASVLRGSAELGPASHVIMMASAFPGEGKTFTSFNLAMSLALEKDIEVLLVDADTPKPHISRALGLENEPGLVDLLEDRNRRASEFILRTDVPNLSVLPAGRAKESITELLASQRTGEVLSQLSAPDGRRIVVLDSPPLLMSTESLVLAQSAGQVVMVVRAESTTRQAVNDAINAIGADKTISLILNQSSAPPQSGYYGYGYYGDAKKPAQSG